MGKIGSIPLKSRPARFHGPRRFRFGIPHHSAFSHRPPLKAPSFVRTGAMESHEINLVPPRGSKDDLEGPDGIGMNQLRATSSVACHESRGRFGDRGKALQIGERHVVVLQCDLDEISVGQPNGRSQRNAQGTGDIGIDPPRLDGIGFDTRAGEIVGERDFIQARATLPNLPPKIATGSSVVEVGVTSLAYPI
jgi:hypothetical protein